VPENIALHSAFNRVLVADQTRGLIAVDLATGDRTVIDQPALDYGSNGSRLQGVAMDLNRSRILYTDSTVDAIFATGPGARTILTDNATGTVDDSAVLFGIQGIGFDKIGNRVLAADSYKKVMWQIDLDTAHRSHVSSDVIGSGPSIDFPGKMDVDTDNGLAYYVEQNSSSLVVADLATGDRTVVSSFSVGAGPNFTSVMDVDLDVANNRAFVSGSSANGGALFTVNLATGDRTLVSDDVTGTGPSMTVPASVAFDSATGRALVMDWNADILFAIDLTSGDRTVVSDNVGIGVGPNFSVPFDMALDIDNNRAVVTDYGADSLFAIDLTSGDRTSLVSFDDIQQLNLLNPYYVVLDLDNDRAFVYDLSVTGMLVIELSTGERAVMAK
jgi:DNA-binding beta-propeller fold protein YncE